MTHYHQHVFVCTNQKPNGKTCCANGGSELIFKHLKSRLTQLNLHGPGKIRVSQSGCLGRCDLGPCIVIYPEGVWYTYQSIDDVDEIIEKHLQKQIQVDRLLLKTTPCPN